MGEIWGIVSDLRRMELVEAPLTLLGRGSSNPHRVMFIFTFMFMPLHAPPFFVDTPRLMNGSDATRLHLWLKIFGDLRVTLSRSCSAFEEDYSICAAMR